MTSSGTYNFNPALADIVLDAWDRCGIRPSALTSDHMISARRSANMVLVRWANRPVNLWAVDEQVLLVSSNTQQYSVPTNTVAILTVVEREFQLGASANIPISLATTISSPSVSITWPAHGMMVGSWVSITSPISIGGVIVQGFYKVATVPDANTITIAASSAATGSATGGAGPTYTTTAGSSVVTMALAAHGVVPGGTWTVYISTSVGGLTLQGPYIVISATTNSLTFDAGATAGASATVSENGGLMQIAGALSTALPTDRVLTPISRDEWAMIPTKTSTSEWATTYWFDRLTSPQLNIWPLPLLSSPKEIHYWRMRQLQDANPQNTETPDLPYRFEYAFSAALAQELSLKWAPDKFAGLKTEAQEAWAEASGEDRERVTLSIKPDLSGYFR